MRRCFAWMIALFVLAAPVVRAGGQGCSGNAITTVTGTVYAPNGTDPLPNVTVYIPTTTVTPLPSGVTCTPVGTPLPGAPIIGTETDVNGNFELDNVPVGSNIPLVIVSGKWRRQLVIPGVTACQQNVMLRDFAVMPSTHGPNSDIPLIAVATGAADAVECVLRKVGISDSEFTDPGGGGRINLFGGGTTAGGTPIPGTGVTLDAETPTQLSLMGGSGSTLSQYDLLMLPCEGGNFTKTPQELANLVTFANSGGRVYSSHFSYSWMYQNSPFNTVANWAVNQLDPQDGTAMINTTFTAGLTLAQWLESPAIGATVVQGQMPISTLRKDTNGVNPPTQSWLTLNDSQDGNPVMQFVFDTPIGAANQCGRVLYNEYHVENPPGGSINPGTTFPQECTTGPMTAQEKLLEYMLFELTDEGGQPSLAPLVQDFGSVAITFSSAPVTFTWTNNSSFATLVKSTTVTGDFTIGSDTCSGISIPAGGSCQVTVVFTPTILGPETGSLTVVAQGNSLTASLTGTGTPGYSLTGGPLSFGSLDVGAHVNQSLTLTNIASRALSVPPFVSTGPFAVSTSACVSPLAAGASCQVTVTFLPTVVGPQTGTAGVNPTSLLYSGLSAALTGNGIDFTITISPANGSVVAGDSATTTATLTPLAGFAAPLSLTCQVAGAAASGCGLSSATVTTPTTVTITLNTTSQYAVIGYGGFGGPGYLWLVGAGTGLLLWWRRRTVSGALRAGVLMVLLAAVGGSLTGCSGKVPAQNAAYTGPGNYTVTVIATDGFLAHLATYTLAVTAK